MPLAADIRNFATEIGTIKEWVETHPEVNDEERDDQESCTSVLPRFDVLKNPHVMAIRPTATKRRQLDPTPT